MARKVITPVVQYEYNPNGPEGALEELFTYLLDKYFAENPLI